MMIFSQPKPPVGYCDPNSELLKYYQDRNFEVIRANRAYEEQNKFLRAKLRELETENFYLGNREVLELQKENRKLKASLRKMYEKYIKPYKTHGGDVLMKSREFCPACNSRIEEMKSDWRPLEPNIVPLADYVEDMKSLMITEELARAEEWGKIWEAASNPRPKPTSIAPLPKDPIEENTSWVTNPEERPWRKLALKHFNNGIS